MKKTVYFYSTESKPYPAILDSLKPEYDLSVIGHPADLGRQLTRPSTVALITFPETAGKIAEYRLTTEIPVLAIIQSKSGYSEKNLLESGVDEVLYTSGNTASVSRRLKRSLRVCEKLVDARKKSKKLDKQLRIKTIELTQSEAEIVHRLSMAAERRDPETGDHIRRMSHYCYSLACWHGFSEDDCRLLLNASPMHDIGKLGVPDSILLTPGKLNPDEWVIMKQHTTFGAKILAGSKSKLVELGHTVALTHHERWDGSGYPSGLKGVSIPIWGRMAALADVFDAMTSKRVYQDPTPVDQAFEYIESQKEQHFDPELADLFLDNRSRIGEIKKQFPN